MSPLPPIAPIGLMPMTPLGPGGAARATDAVGASAAAGGSGFADMLQSAVSGLNDQMTSADRLSEQAATGGLADPTSALVAVEQADLAFTTAVQVRNKLIEGWQELARMQV